MKNITRFTVQECDSLEVDVFEALFAMENDLTTLRIWTCEKITETCRPILQKLAKENNMDVYVELFL